MELVDLEVLEVGILGADVKVALTLVAVEVTGLFFRGKEYNCFALTSHPVLFRSVFFCHFDGFIFLLYLPGNSRLLTLVCLERNGWKRKKKEFSFLSCISIS